MASLEQSPVAKGRVAIVGAGIAGLTTARALARSGCEVVVFDKARGVGGRSTTRRRDPFAFDHGAQYFTCRSERFRSLVDRWCADGVAAVWRPRITTLGGGSGNEAHLDAVDRYVGVPGMSALARNLASGLRVELQSRIERVEGAMGDWCVGGDDGRSHRGFDAVVIATPAPQAVPLLGAAPRLAALADSVALLPCHAVMMVFEEETDFGFDAAFLHRSPLAWVARNASKPGRPEGDAWVLHSTPEWSTRNLEESNEVVAERLVAAFAEAIERPPPKARYETAHRWLYARVERPHGRPQLWDAESRIGVCGDWTCGERIEDAFLSGDLLARAMLGVAPARESD